METAEPVYKHLGSVGQRDKRMRTQTDAANTRIPLDEWEDDYNGDTRSNASAAGSQGGGRRYQLPPPWQGGKGQGRARRGGQRRDKSEILSTIQNDTHHEWCQLMTQSATS